jgi:hypothetical protein
VGSGGGVTWACRVHMSPVCLPPSLTHLSSTAAPADAPPSPHRSVAATRWLIRTQRASKRRCPSTHVTSLLLLPPPPPPGLPLSPPHSPQIRGSNKVVDQDPEGKYEALSKYARDLTAAAASAAAAAVAAAAAAALACL